VRAEGLEPSCSFEHRHLKPACQPIASRPQSLDPTVALNHASDRVGSVDPKHLFQNVFQGRKFRSHCVDEDVFGYESGGHDGSLDPRSYATTVENRPGFARNRGLKDIVMELRPFGVFTLERQRYNFSRRSLSLNADRSHGGIDHTRSGRKRADHEMQQVFSCFGLGLYEFIAAKALEDLGGARLFGSWFIRTGNEYGKEKYEEAGEPGQRRSLPGPVSCLSPFVVRTNTCHE
jgi:hypothetical protein